MTVGGLTLEPERFRTVKASERVAHEIVRDIVRGGLQSGDRLPLEPAMAAKYSVSRSTLREALRLLEMQGLLSLKPGPGGGPVVGTVEPSRVAQTLSLYFHLGSTNYDDLMRTQSELEAVCARLATAHPEREQALAPFIVAHGQGGESQFRGAMIDFHTAVYRLAANPALSLLTQAITHIVTRHVLLLAEPIEDRPMILHDHSEIARAIVEGRGDRAGEMMHHHFDVQHEHLRQRLPGRGAETVEWR